jgi:hypothetical protein
MEKREAKLKDLITNADGTFSRTQITIWIVSLVSIGLVLAEAIRGQVLSTQVLIVLAGLHLFALLDRVDARRIDLKLSKEGAGISLDGGEYSKNA